MFRSAFIWDVFYVSYSVVVLVVDAHASTLGCRLD